MLNTLKDLTAGTRNSGIAQVRRFSLNPLRNLLVDRVSTFMQVLVSQPFDNFLTTGATCRECHYSIISPLFHAWSDLPVTDKEFETPSFNVMLIAQLFFN
jgi:hypothetical protein